MYKIVGPIEKPYYYWNYESTHKYYQYQLVDEKTGRVIAVESSDYSTEALYHIRRELYRRLSGRQ